MGATHLPSTEFDGTAVDDQLEADAEAAMGEPPAQMVQLLGPDGKLYSDPLYSQYAEKLDPERLRGLYADMAAIRRFDVEATALQRQGQLALWVPLTGQEAAQIGSGRASQPQDYIFPTYREHGVALTRNVDLAELLRQFRGVSNGGWNPKDTNFHLYTLVLAAQTPHAVGYAMGIQRDQKLAAAATAGAADRPAEPKAAVMVYFGDGASSEGDVHESMVFASSYNAPVVFFCQNNHWAISVPSSVQTRIPLSNRAKGYGFPGIRVDGNDVIAVHAV
ncbi:MAG: pdhA, partial [Pseudarthrobacter sp.]|nr:pdhA [Pseudarthrobacter sp.]